MNLDIQATPVFEKNWDAIEQGYRTIVNQGGSRSSKTYSILQLILVKCLTESGKTYSIVRKTLPSLKASVLKDWEELIDLYDLRDRFHINKTDLIYKINGNSVEFFSLDSEQKVRGSKRHVLYCNEANELKWKEFQQLIMRTTDYILLDYNPSDSKHWIYSKILVKKDTLLIKSTFLDNPWCPQAVIDELLWLKENDPDGWRVYGLGEIGISKENIFPIFRSFETVPDTAIKLGIGLDWGYSNDPTAVVRGYINGRDIYLEELIYRTAMTNPDIHRALNNLEVNDIIYADSAEPKSIQELKSMGHKIKPTIKGADSIIHGISNMKSYRLFIKGENLEDEFVNYKWKLDKAGDITNIPIDAYNHLIDAARYLITMTTTQKKSGTYNIL